MRVLVGEGDVLRVTAPLNDCLGSLKSAIAAAIAEYRATQARALVVVAAAAEVDGAEQGGAAAAGGAVEADVAALLASLELSEYTAPISAIGGAKLAHLRLMDEEDLIEMGMLRLHRRSLLLALRGAESETAAVGGGRAFVLDDQAVDEAVLDRLVREQHEDAEARAAALAAGEDTSALDARMETRQERVQGLIG